MAVHRRGQAPSSRTHGFTLLEMLIVLAILGLTIGLVAVRGPARSPSLDLRVGVDQVARALRVARSQAIVTNRDVAFTLDLARRAFRVGDGAWQALPPFIELGITAATGPRDTSAEGSISFAPDGSASGGRLRLASALRVRIVTVDWLSGRVAVGDGQ